MSRTTDLGLGRSRSTQGWWRANTSNDPSMKSASGRGQVTSARRLIRSSYSTPSAFIRVISSSLIRSSWAISTTVGSSTIDSTRLSACRW